MGTKPEIIKVDDFTFEVNGTAVEFDSVDSMGDVISSDAVDVDSIEKSAREFVEVIVQNRNGQMAKHALTNHERKFARNAVRKIGHRGSIAGK